MPLYAIGFIKKDGENAVTDMIDLSNLKVPSEKLLALHVFLGINMKL